jgi:hypothetical protein
MTFKIPQNKIKSLKVMNFQRNRKLQAATQQRKTNATTTRHVKITGVIILLSTDGELESSKGASLFVESLWILIEINVKELKDFLTSSTISFCLTQTKVGVDSNWA